MSPTQLISIFNERRFPTKAVPRLHFLQFFTFGEGLQDSETLPQTFSDLENQRLRILNFGISGYGPQQFLRAMETGIFRRLRNSRLIVLLTAPWHAERTSCLNPSMMRSPRYIMKDGQVTYFTGACAYRPLRILWEIVGHSAAYRALLSPTSLSLILPTSIFT